MTDTINELSEDAFAAHYPLRTNHLNPTASWANGEGAGCLFETYGKELAFVREQNPRTVWTLIDGDDGDQCLLSGFHLVNRLGYLVSTVPVPEKITIQVHIPMRSKEAAEADDGTEIDVHELLAGRKQIAAIWSIEDVQQARPDLTDEQAWQVLRDVDRHHDAEIGINWSTLECTAGILFGEAPETATQEDE